MQSVSRRRPGEAACQLASSARKDLKKVSLSKIILSLSKRGSRPPEGGPPPAAHARHMRARPGHVHYALFRASSGQCLLNQASAGLAGSATCIDCVPEGGSLCNLKPTRSWNKQGWMIEDMP